MEEKREEGKMETEGMSGGKEEIITLLKTASETYPIGADKRQKSIHNTCYLHAAKIVELYLSHPTPKREEQPETEGMSDKDIQNHIENNTRWEDGTPAMDEQAFYEGAKWMRGKLSHPTPKREEQPMMSGEEIIKFARKQMSTDVHSHKGAYSTIIDFVESLSQQSKQSNNKKLKG